MEELIRGRELANQLRFLFEKRNPVSGDEDFDISGKDLTNKILQSFNTAISQLNSGETDVGVSQNPVSSDDRKSVDSGESKRILVGSGDRKGGYKRRKNSHTWVKITPTPIKDGHAWRKYGQKEILNAKFPRSYFRCTHKKDQDCRATKHVQKTEDDPSMYHTTYIGHHTCRSLDKLKTPQLILDSDPRDSCLINFVSILAPPKQAYNNSTISSSPIVKQEFSREERANDQDLMTHKDSSPSPPSSPPPLSPSEFLWTDLPPFVFPTMLGSTSGISEHGDGISDIYSCETSDQSFDMDLMVGSVINFDEGTFYFDEAFLKK